VACPRGLEVDVPETITLLVVASWMVFWFEVVNLYPQVSTGRAILLSFVTFNYAINFSLPKLAFPMFIDRRTLTSFAFVPSVSIGVLPAGG
jgi:hypothetical protein